MGYQQALEAAGEKIKEFKEFGSYQGDWFAINEQNEVISGSYGSCSGCDAFQGEFSWGEEAEERDGKYYRDWSTEITKEEFEEQKELYQKRLSDFGQSYIDTKETLSEAISRYEIKSAEEWAWEDDKEILAWLKSISTEV